ncbi:MAG TPA: hypothetical protein VJU59_26390 [Paraburkholderia sp.]|uniref:hypothetical protein n=1 Tax=Paraburkholderia sp. TaxID=1926495 RepID=UPI002B4642D6|nr:hypothetical protein [Paraburkholderia sp.]HKR43169.1 hypothetical protein [Paraburkholderia sp.]
MKLIARGSCEPNGAQDQSVLGQAMQSGLATATASAAVVAWRGASEGSTVFGPINAVTHCLWPRRAFGETRFSPRFTLAGLAIHQASAAFWAALFEVITHALHEAPIAPIL